MSVFLVNFKILQEFNFTRLQDQDFTWLANPNAWRSFRATRIGIRVASNRLALAS